MRVVQTEREAVTVSILSGICNRVREKENCACMRVSVLLCLHITTCICAAELERNV